VFDIGGDFRFNADAFVPPGDDESTLSFETERANIYLESSLVEDRLTLYLDQQFSPAGNNREAWALYSLGDTTPTNSTYLKVGKMFLPFGLRIQDDTALVRTASGINFLTPDNGVELGFDRNQWSTQIAISKLSAEYRDPNLDVDEDHMSRVSLVWEATPVPLLQLRAGARLSQGIPQSAAQNTDYYFVQLHAWY